MGKNRYAYEIEHVVIYQFSESLFFANIKMFQEDIENSIREDTKVIVDAGGVTNIDITAADRLEMLAESLRKRKNPFLLDRAQGYGECSDAGTWHRSSD